MLRACTDGAGRQRRSSIATRNATTATPSTATAATPVGTRECGNDVIDGECGEVCDGDELAGQTCAGGVVTCAADCRSVDRSQCPVDCAPQEVCGNCIDDDLKIIK